MTTFRRHLKRLFGSDSFTEVSDSALLDRFVTHGEEAAFADLVERHGPMVLGVCRRVLHDLDIADDAFQATFLVLFRKAGSIMKRESLASWLYGVAYRIALQAGARRAKTWTENPRDDVPNKVSTPMHDDVRNVIDEELNRLPEKLRAPLVLCYLEGKSNEEAAQLLGCPFGTLSSRLARGRDRLRVYLERRGLAITSAGLSALLVPDQLSAAVSNPLAGVTVSTILAAASGRAVPAPIAALAQGAMNAMFLTKARTALILLVAFTLAATGLVHGAFLSSKDAPREKASEPKEARIASIDKAGVTFALKPKMEPFAAGDRPGFDLIITNNNKKDIVIEREDRWGWPVHVISVKTKEKWFLRGHDAPSGPPVMRPIAVEAGKEKTFRFNLPEFVDGKRQHKFEAGEYRVEMELVFHVGGTLKDGRWGPEVKNGSKETVKTLGYFKVK